jgi:hypothetical protein
MSQNTTIEPADCFARVARIRGELDLLRAEMGRPADAQPDIGVTGAEPRECYFVAMAMFRKADRLCFEHTGESGTLPYPPPLASVKAGDVYTVLEGVLDRLSRVKSAFGMKDNAAEPPRDAAKTPSDVFRTVVSANRQLNLLLEHPFAPADCHQQVSLANSYAAALRVHVTGSNAATELPAFERGKRPADCYRKLGEAIDRVEVIVAAAGLKMLDLTVGTIHDDRVLPADVYDLASLLVAELAYVHSQTPGLAPVHLQPLVPPGKRLPSHVYQLAAAVDRQLATVQSALKEKPGALKAK